MATDRYCISDGQSNPAGADARPAVPVSGIPAWAGITNALLANTNSGAHSTLGPRGDGNQATQISQGYALAALRPTERIVRYLNAVGGQPIANLLPGGGSGSYEAALTALPAAFNTSISAGNTPTVAVFNWNQGEGDLAGNTRPLTYKARFGDLRTAYRTGTLGALPGMATAPWLLVQTGQWGYRGAGLASTLGSPNPIGIAQWELARDTADIYMGAPIYAYEFESYINPDNGFTPSPLHLSPRGQIHLGEVLARIEHRLINGQGWAPLQPLYAVKTGLTSIDVKFQVPVPPLRWNITDPQWGDAGPHKGFAVAGTASTVTRADIVGADVVRLTVDQPIPEPAVTVTYGMRYLNTPMVDYPDIHVVGIGNLTDSETAVSAYDSTPLPNWAVHSQVPAAGGVAIVTGKSYLMQSDGLYELAPSVAA